MTAKMEYMKYKYTDQVLNVALLELANDHELYPEVSFRDKLRWYCEDYFNATEEELVATRADVGWEEDPNGYLLWGEDSNGYFLSDKNLILAKKLRIDGCTDEDFNITDKGKQYIDDNCDYVAGHIRVWYEKDTAEVHESKVEDVESQEFTNQFELIKLYIKLGILRLEDSEQLLIRAMSNKITNEEREFLRKIYVGEIQ